MDRYPGILVRVGPALGGDCVGLVGRVSGIDVAVLKDHRGVSEDEVDGAIYVALAVELPLRVGIKGVLESLDAAHVEHREVGTRT